MTLMHNIEEFRRAAMKRLPRPIFDYLEGGAEDEIGLIHNREAFANIKLVPRRLRDVSGRTCETTLFGNAVSTPLVVAPTGLNGLFWPKGDVALARAAAREGVPFVLSTASNTNIEDLARASDGDRWFQLYVLNRELAQSLVRRSFDADYSTLVLTVDVSINGNRERDVRNNFSASAQSLGRRLIWGMSRPRWACQMILSPAISLANFSHHSYNPTSQAALISRKMDDTFNWDAFQWLRSLWPRKLLVKGILHPEDAAQCVALGADGVILSNHGGRQLDTAVSPIKFLGEVAAASPNRILIDSGFRRGSDVVKAMALGAHGVLVGRPVLYGLAVSGEQGVREVLRIFSREIEGTLCQLGCKSVSDVSSHHLG